MGSVTYGLGADISLPPCLSVRPGIWKFSVLRLKATSGPKSRGASSRYSALATRPEVPSPGPTFFYDRRMRTRGLGPLRRGLLFSLTCNTAALCKIGWLNVFQIQEISNSNIFFLMTNFTVVKKRNTRLARNHLWTSNESALWNRLIMKE